MAAAFSSFSPTHGWRRLASLKRALDELGETFNVGTSQPLGSCLFHGSEWNGTRPGSTRLLLEGAGHLEETRVRRCDLWAPPVAFSQAFWGLCWVSVTFARASLVGV